MNCQFNNLRATSEDQIWLLERKEGKMNPQVEIDELCSGLNLLLHLSDLLSRTPEVQLTIFKYYSWMAILFGLWITSDFGKFCKINVYFIGVSALGHGE